VVIGMLFVGKDSTSLHTTCTSEACHAESHTTLLCSEHADYYTDYSQRGSEIDSRKQLC
jgi:hypothetical protein